MVKKFIQQEEEAFALVAQISQLEQELANTEAEVLNI